MGEIPQDIRHRFTNREKSPYTDESEKELVSHGFVFIGEKRLDESLDESFDRPESAFVAEYRKKLEELMESGETPSYRPPSNDVPMNIKPFVLGLLTAGYEVRLCRNDSRVRMFARFDLDRILFRGRDNERDEQTKPGTIPGEDILKAQTYQLDSTMTFHYWGDYDMHIGPERLSEYAVENRFIEERVKALVQQGNDVRLVENHQGGIIRMILYRRSAITMDIPYRVEPHISIITSESPECLKANGFHFVDNATDDATVEKKIEKKEGTPDKTHLAFMTAYWQAGRELFESGQRVRGVAPNLFKLKDRLLHFREGGYDIRLVHGIYNESDGTLRDDNRYALFVRFDLGLFIAWPKEHPQELIDEKGYHPDGEFHFTAWGDTLLKILFSDIQRVHAENHVIESHITKRLSEGARIRLFWGKYDSATSNLDRTVGCISCFKR